MSDSKTDWMATNPALAPPFNRWPRWALEWDIEVSDRIGTLTAPDEDDPCVKRIVDELQDCRNLLQEFLGVALEQKNA